MKLLILNGPNMQLLGQRNPAIYGTQTLQQLNERLRAYAKEQGIETEFLQTNHEGVALDALALQNFDGVVLNAAAWTHTSVALRDCIEAIVPPVVEVHLSDLSAREDFRKTSMIRDVVAACFMGEGENSYRKAIEWLKNALNDSSGR